MNANKTASRKIRAHKQYTEADYAHLSKKGYTNTEILKIWDRDQAERALPAGRTFIDREIVEFYIGK